MGYSLRCVCFSILRSIECTSRDTDIAKAGVIRVWATLFVVVSLSCLSFLSALQMYLHTYNTDTHNTQTLSGGVISVDERFFDSFGKTYAEVAGRPFSSLVRDQVSSVYFLFDVMN